MDICKFSDNFSFKLKGSCGPCLLKQKEKNQRLTFQKILPGGLCPFAYYSIIPYWTALIQGAWFRWEKNKNEVVCQCPRPQGVIFLIKRIYQPEKIAIQVEVKKSSKSICPYQYSKGTIFKIDQSFCPALFPSLWSQLDKLEKPTVKILKLNCPLEPISCQVHRLQKEKLRK